MSELQRQTQVRNKNILQLRGMLPRVASLIPDDVKRYMTREELVNFSKTADSILKILNMVKVVRFVCADCAEESETRITKNKKATACDVCGDYMRENLYIAKRDKCL